MIRIMIVEDEYLQRQLLKKIVNWTDLGAKIVGETDNGDQAIELAEQMQPDIVFMDIEIKGTNGIIASLKIKEKMPYCNIIIITAYGKFDYAKGAISAGVSGYLLKPIDPDKLIEEYKKAMHKCIEIMEQKKQQKQVYLTSVINGWCRISPKDLEKHDIYIMKYVSLIYMKIEKNQNKEGLKDKLYDQMKTFYPHGELIQLESVFIFCISQDCETIEEFLYGYSSFANLLIELLGEAGVREYAIGRSSAHLDATSLPICYREASDAFIFARDNNRKSVINFESTNYVDIIDSVFESMNRLQHLLGKKQFYDAEKTLLESLTNIKSEKIQWQTRFYFYDRLLGTIYEEFGNTSNDQKIRNFRVNLQNACQMNDFPRIDDITHTFAGEMIERLKSNKDTGNKRVNLAKKYIEQHYMDLNLSLSQISDSIRINPCYLSSIFKNNTGYSFSEYLTNYRLEKAKILMKEQPELPLYGIAYKVGYSDYYYFSKKFKQRFGITPSQFYV